MKNPAMDILHEFKLANKRIFIITIILLIGLLVSIGYIIYLLNDIGTTTTTQEIKDVSTINGGVVNNGDNYGNDKTNNKN